VVEELEGYKEKILVLGDILELGSDFKQYYQDISKTINKMDTISEVYTYGEKSHLINEYLKDNSNINSRHFTDESSLVKELDKQLIKDNLSIKIKIINKVKQMTILTFIISFIITSVLLLVSIPYLKRLKFGQSIREDGPQTHLTKTGTPTMGGLMIVIGVLITFVILSLFNTELILNVEFWLLTLVLVGF